MTKAKFSKRMLSMLLAIVMVVGLVPGFALSVSAETASGTTTGTPCDEIDCEGTYNASGFCSADATHYQPAKQVSETHHSELNASHSGYYAIENAGQLYWFAQQVNAAAIGTYKETGQYQQKHKQVNVNAVLVNDITVNAKVLNEDGTLVSNTDSLTEWTPIGDYHYRSGVSRIKFVGIFDGNNCTVSGLYRDKYGTENTTGESYIGFFSYTQDATVKNLTIRDSYFAGYDSIGGIAGCFWGKGTMENCTSYATIKALQDGGGVAGQMTGTITNCHNHGLVTGSNMIGGFTGMTSGSSVFTKCSNTATIKWISGSASYFGGFTAYVSSGTVTFRNCFNTGDVIYESKNTASNAIGGFIGIANGTLENCYAACTVTVTYADTSTKYETGAFAASLGTTVSFTNCYFDNDKTNYGATNDGDADGITGKTTAQFESGEVCYLLNGSKSEGDDLVWYQTLKTHKTPVFDGKVVYHDASANPQYFNERGSDPEPTTYTVTVSDSENGNVTADITTAAVGTTVNLTITPDDGYALASLSIDGADVTESVSNGKYSFDMPANDVTVSATFKRVYKITISSDIEHGSVTADKDYAAEGELITLTVIPDENYAVSTYTIALDVSGSVSVTVSDGTFTMPASNVTVSVKFYDTRDYLVITPANPGYSVTRTSDTVYPVPAGGNYSFTVTIGNGYDASNLVVRAKPYSGSGSSVVLTPDENGIYTIENINEKMEVYVTGVLPYKPDSADDFGGSNYPFAFICTEDDSHTLTAPYFDSEYVTLANITGSTGAGCYLMVTFQVKDYFEDNFPGHVALDELPETAEFKTKWNIGTKKWDYVNAAAEYSVVCAYSVTVDTDIQNGEVSVDKTMAAVGSEVTVTVAPDDGYRLASLIVGGTDVTESVSDNKYSFTMPANDVTVTAVLEKEIPVISVAQELSNQGVTEGKIIESLIFEASVSDGSTPTYQWYRCDDADKTNAVKITGQTNSSMELPKDLTEGTYYFYAVAGATGAESIFSRVAIVTVTRLSDTASVSEEPISIDPVYSGLAQELVAAGVAEGGAMRYALGTNGTTAPTDGWDSKIPTATDAGTYYVWYKVVGDSTHNDSTPVCVEATVEKAWLDVTADDLFAEIGDEDCPTPTYTITGFVNGETAITAGITGTPVLTYDETPDMSKEWYYSIEVNTDEMSADNYDFNPIPGGLTVLEHVHVFDESSYTLGTTLTENDTIFATCTKDNCPENKTVALIQIEAPEDAVYAEGMWHTASLWLDAQASVDSEDITYSDDPVDAGTYTASITYKNKTASVTYKVAQRELTITADDKSVSVGDSAPEYTYTIDGWDEDHDEEYGHKVSGITAVCDGADLTQIGRYIITISGTPAVYDDETNVSDNYTFTSQNGTLTVTDTYTVTLVTNGGTIRNGNVTEYTYGSGAVLPTSVTRNSYNFGGWYDNEACTGTPVTEITASDSGDKTFYAKWNRVYISNITTTYPPVVDGGDNGEVIVTPQKPEKGDTVIITPNPDAGYEVDEIIVTDQNGDPVTVIDNGDGTYSFKQPTGKVNIEVTFKAIVKVCPRDYTCPMYGYTDLDRAAWYHDGVHFCLDNGLMVGYPDDLFMPDAGTTRAMLVTMLWRFEGAPVVNYLMMFDDVEQDAWYAEAVRWAASEGIVLGYDDTTFAPDDSITREQMAALLYRYIQKNGGGFTGMWMFLLDYADRTEISDWAYESVCYMTMHGLMQGKNDKVFDPQGSATRAEVATLFQRYCVNLEK